MPSDPSRPFARVLAGSDAGDAGLSGVQGVVEGEFGGVGGVRNGLSQYIGCCG